MIKLYFGFVGDKILITIKGNDIKFANTAYGAKEARLKDLKLSKAGVEVEFPELKGRDDWREQALKRFEKKIYSLKTEREKVDYIIDDLSKFGYILEQEQREGLRPKIIK